jgi:genome maintenance exonuclease 1
MKNFIHHDIPKIKRVNDNGTRVYLTPTGEKYPSVTTVTGFGTKKEIMEWRDRVGHEEANRISTRAANRGTRLHKLCEDHMHGKPIDVDMFDLEIWSQFKGQIDHIDNIHGIESKLYSHRYKVAGTCDLIGEYKGKLSIIDWKTSRRLKGIDEVDGYLMQCAAYAECFQELTSLQIDSLVVIIGTDDQQHPVVFQEDKNKWLKKFKQKRYLYYKYYKL